MRLIEKFKVIELYANNERVRKKHDKMEESVKSGLEADEVT